MDAHQPSTPDSIIKSGVPDRMSRNAVARPSQKRRHTGGKETGRRRERDKSGRAQILNVRSRSARKLPAEISGLSQIWARVRTREIYRLFATAGVCQAEKYVIFRRTLVICGRGGWTDRAAPSAGKNLCDRPLPPPRNQRIETKISLIAFGDRYQDKERSQAREIIRLLAS